MSTTIGINFGTYSTGDFAQDLARIPRMDTKAGKRIVEEFRREVRAAAKAAAEARSECGKA